jgi:hypothetical protein
VSPASAVTSTRPRPQIVVDQAPQQHDGPGRILDCRWRAWTPRAARGRLSPRQRRAAAAIPPRAAAQQARERLGRQVFESRATMAATCAALVYPVGSAGGRPPRVEHAELAVGDVSDAALSASITCASAGAVIAGRSAPARCAGVGLEAGEAGSAPASHAASTVRRRRERLTPPARPRDRQFSSQHAAICWASPAPPPRSGVQASSQKG